MDNRGYFSHTLRTKDAKLHQFILDEMKEIDCSACDYLKQLVKKEMKNKKKEKK